MNPLARVRGKLRRRVAGRRRQYRLWLKTKKRGHLKSFRGHRAATRYLRTLIRKITTPRGVTIAGARFIARFEGVCHEPVNIGDGVTTIGAGRVLHPGSPTAADRQAIWIKGQKTPGRVTDEEAARMLQEDLNAVYSPVVARLFQRGGPLHGKFTPWRQDALTSVVYNLGLGAVQPGTPGFETLGAAINRGDIQGIAEALPLYSNPGSQFHDGLLRRRKSEARLFLTGNYNPIS